MNQIDMALKMFVQNFSCKSNITCEADRYFLMEVWAQLVHGASEYLQEIAPFMIVLKRHTQSQEDDHYSMIDFLASYYKQKYHRSISLDARTLLTRI